MKKVLFFVCFYVLSLVSFSQTNNPFNKRGTDYTIARDTIMNAFTSGRVTEINSTTLNEYGAKIPLQTEMTVELATEVLATLNNSIYNFETEINNSRLGDSIKAILKEMFFNPHGLSFTQFQSYLVNKVNDINSNTTLYDDAAEKEFILSMIAIVYNNTHSSDFGSSRDGCFIEIDGQGGGIPCWIAGAIIGGVTGFRACGIWCGIGGAIIGGVVGALS